MAGVNDFGLKIAQFGYDVEAAGDINLVFSSSWPSLPVAKEIATNAYSGVSPPYGGTAHGLSFPPFTVGWTQISGVMHIVFPDIDSANIYPNADFPNPSSYGYVDFKCFNIDISENVSYPFVAPPAVQSGSYDPDWGIKISKDGKSVNSTDLRDFVLHSRCQSPQILSVTTEANPAGGTLSVTSPLGYTSWVFGYVKQSTGPKAGRWTFAPYYAQAYPITHIDNVNNKYSIDYVAGDQASIVVLRDPMFASSKISASY